MNGLKKLQLKDIESILIYRLVNSVCTLEDLKSMVEGGEITIIQCKKKSRFYIDESIIIYNRLLKFKNLFEGDMKLYDLTDLRRRYNEMINFYL